MLTLPLLQTTLIHSKTKNGRVHWSWKGLCQSFLFLVALYFTAVFTAEGNISEPHFIWTHPHPNHTFKLWTSESLPVSGQVRVHCSFPSSSWFGVPRSHNNLPSERNHYIPQTENLQRIRNCNMLVHKTSAGVH